MLSQRASMYLARSVLFWPLRPCDRYLRQRPQPKTVTATLTLVTTIVAAAPAQAASCLHGSAPCTSNVQCCQMFAIN